MTNEDNLSDTITPKSDQLNADDLLTGPITVRVERVTRGETKEQPVSLHIEGRQPYKPCKSMRRVLIAAWGEKGSAWVGKRLTLYADKSVSFGGAKVGGIRISHVSDITEPMHMLLTTTRSKRSEFVVDPIAESDTERRRPIAARLWKITEDKHGGNKAKLQQWLVDEGFLNAEPIEQLSETSTDRLYDVLCDVEIRLMQK